MELNRPKEKTPQQALEKLMERCAKAETCISDARRLLLRWHIPPTDQDAIIERLMKERFIDEERYAFAFVRDKLNFSRWGARKIAEALYQKRIPAALVKSAMEQAEDVAMGSRLETDLERKNRAIREENPHKRKEKLIRFGISRGYDFETVIDTVERILRETK